MLAHPEGENLMPFRNNTEITAAVSDYINSAQATSARLADWIRLAEKRIMRALTKNSMLGKLMVTKTITTDANPKSLPAGIRGLPEVVYLDKNPKKVLNYMPPNEFFGRWLSDQTNEPVAFTAQGNQIHFGPAPDSSYSAVVWCRQDLNIARTIDQVLIPELDETDFDNSPTTEGTFAGGTGHAAGDVITLSDGSEVTVETVSAGVVTEFTITNSSMALASLGDTLSQSSTTGSGVSFSLTLDQDSLSNIILLDYPELYLYGAVTEGFVFTKNKAGATEYAGLFKEAVDTITDEEFMSGASLQQLQRVASAGTPRRSR